MSRCLKQIIWQDLLDHKYLDRERITNANGYRIFLETSNDYIRRDYIHIQIIAVEKTRLINSMH